MKKAPKQTKHKGSHRVAANHHRHVHKGISSIVIGFWIAAAILTVIGGVGYLDSRHHIRLSDQGVTIRADNVSYDDVGKYPFVPGKGYDYVIVQVTVKNHRATDFDFAPVLQTYLTDSKRNIYFMTPANLKDPLPAGKLSPGESRTGTLSYLVPVGSNGITFHFKL